ncbi:hypothetical protein Amet_3530 [Alkaliphilus metalliredigens QYMF]|uniref:PRC-barrel domain-containing protein n=1 Tax=Alkaliphilus metalliredigens (strain QYMF) TaxID=293826 RepID=A6TTY8_ALKMQ|nr:hypothetical protein [Alkaliphilus metalliredigens]ABR49656.1 hypothetical protein Amet_3530 [Alkaliphilus metalliredigens QYMF]
MIIKISEKPVISIDTGKSLGSLKGFIYKNNKVTFLYCQFSDHYVYIPIQDAYIGPDTIMLKVTEDINMLYTDAATKIYTTAGKEVGTLTSIEMDDLFHITGIMVDDLFIEIDKILHMENIIIVATDKIDTEHTVLVPINTTVPTEVNENSADEVEAEQRDLINQELSLDPSPSSTPTPIQEIEDHLVTNTAPVGDVEQDETDTLDVLDIQDVQGVQDVQDELAIEIDPRYHYLVGKKLLEEITILKETYKKDTLIDVALIQFAIDSNAIVKVIMNTED